VLELLQEVETRLGRQAEIAAWVVHPLNRLALDECLEREIRPVGLRLTAVRAGPEAREPRPLEAEPRLHRRPGVLALELARLPLAGEEPQRVVRLRLQALVDVLAARERLDARPERDRGH
jgi:hypothetical protein